MARATDADLVVLSSSTTASAGVLAEAAAHVEAGSGARVLCGRPGGSLHDLLRLARSDAPDRAGV